MNAILDLTETNEKLYLERLKENASSSLSCLVEFMTPDEVPSEHHEFMCDHLEAILRRDIMRACFSMPPGHAKTKFCSRYFPAFYLGNNPRHRYLQGGHSQSFCENEFGKPVRDIIDDPRFQEVFPEVALHTRSTAAGNWRLNNGRGGYVTKGVGQKLAGYRGHCGGVDDPFGSREDAESEKIRATVRDWFFADFRTRFLPGSPLFIVATRWHPDDLIGVVMDMNKKGQGLPWEIINLNGIIEDEVEAALDPMGRSIGETLWADYYTFDQMMDLKATLTPRDWFSLIKGSPRNVEGNVVKLSWFARYSELPKDELDEHGRIKVRRRKRVTISVDTANKANQRAAYSVASAWLEDMESKHYLMEVVRKKVEITDLIPMIEDLATKHGADQILVEDKGNGTSYIQLRQGKAPAPIVAITPDTEGDKEFRFDKVTPMFEAGIVLFPERAVWLADYENELLEFPNCTFKDQVDSTSQYLNHVRKRRRLGMKPLKGVAHAR